MIHVKKGVVKESELWKGEIGTFYRRFELSDFFWKGGFD